MQGAAVRRRTEVAIVGAGAAGSLFAAKLAQAGKKVLVLEAGPARRTDDLTSSQIWARRLKWGGPPVMSGAPPAMAHNLSFGWGLGGAALHHYATWPRLIPEAFELRSRYGVFRDWPLRYDDLRPYYDRIQDEMGVSGDHEQEDWRPQAAPYPMPPLPSSAHGETIKRGFDALGMRVAPLPAAINSIDRDGRPACIFDGWCDAGCPTGALANPLVTHVPLARKAGATFLTDTTVVEIIADAKGARGLRAVGPGGREIVVEADIVILAASIVQNPRLLLASRSKHHPNGLANRNGLVGAYLCIETGANAVGLFSEPTHNFIGINAGQFLYRAGHRASGKPDGGYQWQIGPAMKPNDIFGVAFTRADLFGRRLDDFLRNDAGRLAAMVGFGADEPLQENRVTLHPAARDAFGVPLAEVKHQRTESARALWSHMIQEGQAVMRAAGAQTSWHGPMIAGHITGGTIMGADPADSVCDSFGRTHEVRNVIVAGAGLFPTSSGASPTFTLYALALRSAERLLANWRDYTI